MKLTKAFKAIMSNGDGIQIDFDEIDKVADACQKRTFVFVRSGMINTVHVVGIGIDQKRIDTWLHDCSYGDEIGARAQAEGMKPLKNIFDGMSLGKKIDEADRLRAQGLNATVGIAPGVTAVKGLEHINH